MPFPNIQRVIYDKNPLDNVICQFRYHPILLIDAEPPVKFQESIRNDYPLFEETMEGSPEIFNFNIQIPNPSFNPMSNIVSTKNYCFSSEDNTWKVNLTRTFLTLSTSAYVQWEDFREKFFKLIDVLINAYKPSFYTRIGLRYIDIFSREKLKLEGADWGELIQPAFIGILSSDISKNVSGYHCEFEVDLSGENGKSRVVSQLIIHNETKERGFLLDSDFFIDEKVDLDAANEKLDFLHARSTRLLRYAIKDKLHQAMEPRNI